MIVAILCMNRHFSVVGKEELATDQSSAGEYHQSFLEISEVMRFIPGEDQALTILCRRNVPCFL